MKRIIQWLATAVVAVVFLIWALAANGIFEGAGFLRSSGPRERVSHPTLPPAVRVACTSASGAYGADNAGDDAAVVGDNSKAQQLYANAKKLWGRCTAGPDTPYRELAQLAVAWDTVREVDQQDHNAVQKALTVARAATSEIASNTQYDTIRTLATHQKDKFDQWPTQ